MTIGYTNTQPYGDGFFTARTKYFHSPADIALGTTGKTIALCNPEVDQRQIYRAGDKKKHIEEEDSMRSHEETSFGECNPIYAWDELSLAEQADRYDVSKKMVSAHWQEGIPDFDCGINPAHLQIIKDGESVDESIYTPLKLAPPGVLAMPLQKMDVTAHRSMPHSLNQRNSNHMYENVLDTGNVVDNYIDTSQRGIIPVYKRREQPQGVGLNRMTTNASQLYFEGHCSSKD